MKFFLLIIITSISVYNCANNHYIDLEQKKYVIDTSVLSRQLSLVDSVVIEENEKLILNTIWGADINNKANKLIICDPDNKTVNLYDYNSGKIIKYLKAGLNLSDSVASSGREYPRFKWLNYESYKYIKIEEYKKYGLGKDYLNFLSNTFYVPYFLDDKIYILSIIYCQTISENNDQVRLTSNRTSVITCDSNINIQNVNVLDIDDLSYAIPYTFHFNNNKSNYFVSATDFAGWRYEKKIDSLPVITKFDIDGNIINIALNLTDKYVKSKIGYKIPWFTKIVEISDEIFFTLSIDLSVYGEGNQKKFELKNLPFSNDTGFTLAGKMDYQLNSIEIDLKQRRKNLNKLFPVQIINGFAINNNLVLHIVVVDETCPLGYYHILQEYTTKGELISQTNIIDDENNRIKFIIYDKENNYLVLFKKGKSLWTMEKRQWL